MASNLPDYVASAQPVPKSKRIPWYASTAQTYAGIMLWFVFWQDVPTGGGAPGGALAQGLGIAFAGLVLAALLCHFLYYVVPGMLGMKTGLPLYIVGTSTYGTTGGFLMPGFLMGVLQFGWLGVNACFSSMLLVAPMMNVASPDAAIGTTPHIIVVIVFAIGAAFMGLKGIQYVAKVATFLPLIPLVILVVLVVMTVGGIGSFEPQAVIVAASGTADKDALAAETAATEAADTLAAAKEGDEKVEAAKAAAAADKAAKNAAKAAKVGAFGIWGVMSILLIYVIGFFATAGAAGCDFGMNNRDANDVQLGGLVGIAGATILAGGLALLIAAGAHGSGLISPENAAAGVVNPVALFDGIVGSQTGKVFMYLLAIAAFPPACFSAFIAANSFKTTLPKVNPFITVGIGTAVSIVLAATGWAANVISVFSVIGASFGPVCGAMAADYLLAGKKWAGPRAAFNPAGWISWIVGFAVGAFNLVAGWIEPLEAYSNVVPVPPLTAMIIGFVLYFVLAKMGLESKTLEMPAAMEEQEQPTDA